MIDITRCRVKPLRVDQELIPKGDMGLVEPLERVGFTVGAWFIWGAACIGAAFLSRSFWVQAISATGAATAIILGLYIWATDTGQRDDVLEQAARRNAEREAAQLSARLRQTYATAAALAEELPASLDRVACALREAQSEHRAATYRRFWDLIEDATNELQMYKQKIDVLSSASDDYHTALEFRQHTFPAFPARRDFAEDLIPTLAQFRQVVRLGQTSHPFASVWELRRTEPASQAGFPTWSDDVSRRASSVELSAVRLQQSLSSVAARVVAGDIKRRRGDDGTHEAEAGQALRV